MRQISATAEMMEPATVARVRAAIVLAGVYGAERSVGCAKQGAGQGKLGRIELPAAGANAAPQQLGGLTHPSAREYSQT